MKQPYVHATQHTAYLPYGELLVDEHSSSEQRISEIKVIMYHMMCTHIEAKFDRSIRFFNNEGVINSIDYKFSEFKRAVIKINENEN